MFISAWDLWHNPPAVIESLWGEAILPRRAFTLLHSSEKQGKSVLSMNLMLAGAAALDAFLGHAIIGGGFTSVCFQQEVHLRGMWERLQKMVRARGLDPAILKRIHLNSDRTIRLASDASWGQFLVEVRAYHPCLVNLDPLARLGVLDENSNPEMGKVLERIATLCEDPGSGVLVVHHDGKLGDGGLWRPPAQRSRGANRITADPDTIISQTPRARTIRGPRSTLHFLSRYGRTIPPIPVALNEDTLWFEEASEDVATEIARWVAEAGGSMDEATLLARIGEEFGLRDKRLRPHKEKLAEAVAAGTIKKSHDGEFPVYTTSGGLA